MGLFSKDIQTMDDLFVHTLRDIYYAENQIVKALPEMIEKAIRCGASFHRRFFYSVRFPSRRRRLRRSVRRASSARQAPDRTRRPSAATRAKI